MTKTIFLGITISAVLITGLLAFIPAPQVYSGATDTTERDNTTITKIKLEKGQRLVLVDNAGTPATSDVEVTWRFDGTECGLNTFTTTGTAMVLSPFSPPGDDMAFAGNPAHNDEIGVDGVVLITKPDKDCELDPGKGEFVTVSTVGSN